MASPGVSHVLAASGGWVPIGSDRVNLTGGRAAVVSGAMLHHVDGRVMLADDPKLIVVHLIVESAIDKLDIVSHLTPPSTAVLDESIGSILAQRRILQAQYQRLMDRRAQQAPTWNRRTAASDAAAVEGVARSLRASDLAMQKRVQNEKALSTATSAKIRREKTRALAILQKAVKELEADGQCLSLVSVLEEEREHERRYKELVDAVRRTLASSSDLSKQLASEREQGDAEDAKRAAEIAALKSELERCRKALDGDQAMIEAQNAARVRSERRLAQADGEDMSNKIAVADSELTTQTKAFAFVDAYLKRRTETGEVDLSEWQKRRADDVSNAERKVGQLRADRDAQVKDLERCQAILKREQIARAKRIEQDRRAREREIAERRAATRIQAVFRGHRVRQEVRASRDAPGKKKKGKGKKGKKGKQ